MTDRPEASGRLADLADEAREAAESIEVWIARAVWVVLLAGVAAFLVAGADRPADPFLVRPDGTVIER
ncbi:MAG TPA: hypothetical protein VMN58_10540 [Acidimicrobiales bacterium]|nr:hypothetical protein [Acidimicrobiales bacterium]